MLDGTGRAIIDGGEELTQTAKTLEVDTRELIEGGSRLTDVAQRMEADLRVLRPAMPQLLNASVLAVHRRAASRGRWNRRQARKATRARAATAMPVTPTYLKIRSAVGPR